MPYDVLLFKCLVYGAVWAIPMESTSTDAMIGQEDMLVADSGTGCREEKLSKVLNPWSVKAMEKMGASERRIAGIIEFRNIFLSAHIIEIMLNLE